VVRCRLSEGGTRRIEIEHVQSGGRVRVASILAAAAWIDARWSDTPPAAARPPGGSGGPAGRGAPAGGEPGGEGEE
jgi:hypothetical protein